MVNVLTVALLEPILKGVNHSVAPVRPLQDSIVLAEQRSLQHVLADTHVMAVRLSPIDIIVLLVVQLQEHSVRLELVLLAVVSIFQCHICMSLQLIGLIQRH